MMMTKNVSLTKCRPSKREGPRITHRGARPDCRVLFTHEGASSKLAWAGSPSAERIRSFPALTSKSTA
jgi:hypothetical protein